MVDTIEINNNKYKYDYDKLGNIINIYNNDVLEYEYSYDEYNQLLKENNYINNTTTRYKYDNYGNILYKKIYYLNTYNQISQNKYEYKNNSFKDLLTKFNNEEILYDGIGNPTNIGSKNLTWINGRQLQSYSDSINNITYKYNKDGIRTSKTVNNVKTMYELEGNDIVFEKTGSNMIYYIRSASELIGLKYNDNIYYYIKNNQNDIIGIADSNYNIIANYKYDSFGNIISITDDEGSIITDNNHIAIINPFRYRCYYYDRETNLYYLNSRYYNPEWGRFINADGIINGNTDIIGHNLYAYCSNNPVNLKDNEGKFALSISISSLLVPLIVVSLGVAASKLVPTIPKAITSASVAAKEVANSFSTTITKSKNKNGICKVTPPQSNVIYRYGKINPGNLTPNKKDYDFKGSGLSFSTLPPVNSKKEAGVTTIDAINSTGVLYAVRDGEYHVSVYPVNATIGDWYLAGTESVWTKALQSVVIKWDGGS